LKSSGARSKAEHLIERDELEEGKSLGQDVKDAFPKADLFVDARAKDTLEENIRRFVELLFGYPYHTPTKDEYAMYHAKSAAVRSADLGRQVGAAIATPGGDIISVGCNEVPKSGGGLYWEGDTPDGRDFQRGGDATFEQREQMVAELVGRFNEHGWLAEKYRNVEQKELVRNLLAGKHKDVLNNTQLFSLLEFGRGVHAEMAAITDAARRGVSVKGGILYTTTFPCHLCAKHIIAAGIERVVYIEPYPKSRARDLFDDSIVVDPVKHVKGRVNFEPFVGVAPRQYLEIFQVPEAISRKNELGKAIEWTKSEALPRVTRFRNTYRDIEQAIIASQVDTMRKKLGLNQQLFQSTEGGQSQ
jgi:cytidine deaminase